MNDKKEKIEDQTFSIYCNPRGCLDGRIDDGCLTINSEIWDKDFESEYHIVFTKEDTDKLFSIITFDEFIDLLKEKDINGLDDICKKHDINPSTFCI